MFGNDVVLHQEFDRFVGLRSFSSRFAGNLVQHLAEDVLRERSHKSQDPLIFWWSISEGGSKHSISPNKYDKDKDLAQKPCIPGLDVWFIESGFGQSRIAMKLKLHKLSNSSMLCFNDWGFLPKIDCSIDCKYQSSSNHKMTKSQRLR